MKSYSQLSHQTRFLTIGFPIVTPFLKGSYEIKHHNSARPNHDFGIWKWKPRASRVCMFQVILPQVLTHFELFRVFEFRSNSNGPFSSTNGGLNVSLNTKNGCKTGFGCVSRLLVIVTFQTMGHFEPFDVLVNPDYLFANHALQSECGISSFLCRIFVFLHRVRNLRYLRKRLFLFIDCVIYSIYE